MKLCAPSLALLRAFFVGVFFRLRYRFRSPACAEQVANVLAYLVRVNSSDVLLVREDGPNTTR